MCGIAGIVGVDAAASFERLFENISHRGPDAFGAFRHANITMGMNRLTFRGGNIALPAQGSSGVSAYNGQIYGSIGHPEYRAVETGLLHEIAAALHEPEPDGMYALAHYSPERGELLLRTDPHFIKPMFVHHENEQVAFCSELGSLLQRTGRVEIDLEALAELFAYGWYLSDKSWAQDVSLVWRNDMALNANGVEWRPKPQRPRYSELFSLQGLRAAIRQSVSRSVQGSGPIGLALSGGLDSTILAHELNALNVENVICVTVLTNDGEDNLEALSDLNLPKGSWDTWRHIKVRTDDAGFLTAFERSTHEFAQPTTMSSLPLYSRLADAAAEAGVRALILGEGVDEYFGGYSSYLKVRGEGSILDYYSHPPRELLTRTLFGAEMMKRVRARFSSLYRTETDIRMIESQLRLTRLLLRSDVCLMRRSIEGRVPFLHNNIPAMALALDWDQVVRNGGKAPLRHAYAAELGLRANAPKVRFKAPDAMLVRCLERADLRSRILAGAGGIFGEEKVEAAMKLLMRPATYDADTVCLLLSLTFLVESGRIQ